ncbi:MAG: DNA-binding response regulator [Bacteroidota bacterium]|nr:DNA-binding response regulator [Bacteroidota bacterium]
MKRKAVIVEDEIHSAGDLKNLIGKYCADVEVLSVAQTVRQAVEVISDVRPDLVFLDVELPDGDGFDVLSNFLDHYFDVIFVTAYDNYALKAIKICALDYLLKPVDKTDLIGAINKVRLADRTSEYRQRTNLFLHNNNQHDIYKQKIALPTMEGLMFVQKDEILYCNANGGYTNFFLRSKEKIVACKPLSYFEQIFDKEHFCRTHQSFLVNLLHVSKYMKGKGGHLVIADGTKIPVSVRMKSDFLDRFEK